MVTFSIFWERGGTGVGQGLGQGKGAEEEPLKSLRWGWSSYDSIVVWKIIV